MESERTFEQVANLKAEMYDPSRTPWNDIKERIETIERACFGGVDSDSVYEALNDPKNVTVLLKKDADYIVGYSVAVPDAKEEEAMYIGATSIDPEYQNRGAVGTIMQLMENEIRARGFEYITRDARIENGYADAIVRHYQDRVAATNDHYSVHGPVRYFKIKL